ncbi:uncharacterized protein LOC135450650 [Zonotrichia leucophrys gambelii]|uniref:uncharacterized protein LOC135450650 n=1 Tax=Zonotrichia leucophrys gambelii TaxID=257770 RepID=UPI003140855A
MPGEAACPRRPVCSSGPKRGADAAPSQLGSAAGRHRGSPGPPPRPEPGACGCWPRPRALWGRASGAGRGQRPAQGQSPHQPFPSVPCRSLQLAEDRSRAAEHLRLTLPYLRSAQEPLREAAVRFMGMAGRYLTGQQPEFHIICSALQDMTDDSSPAISCLALQALYILLAVRSVPSSRVQRMRDQLRRLWKWRPFLCGRG